MTTLLMILVIALLVSAFIGADLLLQSASGQRELQLVSGGGIACGALAVALLTCGLTVCAVAAEQADPKEEDSVSESKTLDDIEFQVKRRFTKTDSGKLIELDEDDSPIADVVFPEDRPAWVEQTTIGKGDRHTIAVSSDMHFRKQECDRTLKENIKKAVDAYINRYLNDSKAAMLLRYDLETIEDRFIAQTDGYYEEMVGVSFGSMHQTHGRLEFNEEFRNELDSRWEKVMATSRLLTVGLGAAGVLSLLSIAFGYLRLDTATKGYYTGRLQFLATVAILSLIAAGSLFVRLNGDWLRWF